MGLNFGKIGEKLHNSFKRFKKEKPVPEENAENVKAPRLSEEAYDLLVRLFEEFDSIYYYHGSTQNWSMKGFHFHKQYEIILFLNDGATLEVENCVYPVQKGDLFLINNKEYHRTCGVEGKDYARYVLMFDPEMLSSMKDAFQYDFKEFFEQRRENFMHKLSLEGENLAKIERLFLEVEQYAGEKNDPVVKVNLKLTILRLLIAVNEMYHFLVYDGNENVLLEQESVDFESPVLYRERIEQIKNSDDYEEFLNSDEAVNLLRMLGVDFT